MTASFASRNSLQGLPDAAPKGRMAYVRGKIQADPGRLHEADGPNDHRVIVLVVADQLRLRKTILKIAHEFIRIVADDDRRHTLVTGRHQYGA